MVSPPPTNHLVILGAGVCGLYAALTALRKGFQVTILERESFVGGLATGHEFNGNYYDTGVHMLHAFDQEIFDDIASLMGAQRLEVQLDARIRWGETTYRYPLRFADLVKEMPPLMLTRGVVGLLLAELQRALRTVDLENAEDALISFYGAPLYEFFFEEFTHRYWGIHPRDLDAEFIRRKMPRLSAVDFVRQKLLGFLPNRKNLTTESSLEQETLHYSAQGAALLPKVLSEEIARLGGCIHLGTTITQVRESSGIVTTRAKYNNEESELKLNSTYVISTIPLTSLVPLITDSTTIHLAARKLKYKPIVIYGLLINKDQALDGLYTYYRNRIFHRVGEPKNAGLRVTPNGHTVLIVEFTCEIDDPKWQAQENIRQQVTSDLAAEGICEPHNIVEWHIMTNPYGYPIFDQGFQEHLSRVQTHLEQHCPRVISTGRQGGFTYPGMHLAMRMGADAVHNIT